MKVKKIIIAPTSHLVEVDKDSLYDLATTLNSPVLETGDEELFVLAEGVAYIARRKES